MEDIMYIITLKPNCIDYMKLTTISRTFCAKMIKSEYNNIYFELNGSKAIIIIPEAWIESMAPSKKYWELKQKKYILYRRDTEIAEVDYPINCGDWHTKEI